MREELKVKVEAFWNVSKDSYDWEICDLNDVVEDCMEEMRIDDEEYDEVRDYLEKLSV